MSINNAFGRLWPANAPFGLEGIGTSTIVDPTGLPLAGAPNQQTGGVYAGDLTPRQPTQVLPGALNRGAVGRRFSDVRRMAPGGRCSASWSPMAASSRSTQRRPSMGSRPRAR
jgi:hypothetical protein